MGKKKEKRINQEDDSRIRLYFIHCLVDYGTKVNRKTLLDVFHHNLDVKQPSMTETCDRDMKSCDNTKVHDLNNKRRVSFGENTIWRPVLPENVEEHLCRIFGFNIDEYSGEIDNHISPVKLRKMYRFFQRSAKAVGFVSIINPVFENFEPNDSTRWKKWQDDGTSSVDEINEVLPVSLLEGFKFSSRDIQVLIDSIEKFPEHEFIRSESFDICSDCTKPQNIWCKSCDACKSCSDENNQYLCPILLVSSSSDDDVC